MGNVDPYRLSARAVPARDSAPRSVTVGLSVAAFGFGVAALTWGAVHAVTNFAPSLRAITYAPLLYVWTLDAAMTLAAALCAWRPFPRTRSHVFARLSLVGGLVAVVAERWPTHTTLRFDPSGRVLEQVTDPSGLLLASTIGRLVLFGSLAVVALVAGRRFALPRWIPVIAGGFAASLTPVDMASVLPSLRAGLAPVPHPTYWAGLTDLLMLVAFATAFGAVAYAVRRRPFLDDEALLSTAPVQTPANVFDARAWAYWRASLGAVLACAFAVASRIGEALRPVASFAAWGPSRTIGWALGSVLLLVFVERARRRHAAESSWALTLGAGVSAFCGVASVLAGGGAVVFGAVGLVTSAVTLGGIALLLPNLPTRSRVVTEVKGSITVAVFFMVLSAGANLPGAGVCLPQTTWFSGPTISLAAALLFVTRALHQARRIEREAMIAEALAARGVDGGVT